MWENLDTKRHTRKGYDVVSFTESGPIVLYRHVATWGHFLVCRQICYRILVKVDLGVINRSEHSWHYTVNEFSGIPTWCVTHRWGWPCRVETSLGNPGPSPVSISIYLVHREKIWRWVYLCFRRLHRNISISMAWSAMLIDRYRPRQLLEKCAFINPSFSTFLYHEISCPKKGNLSGNIHASRADQLNLAGFGREEAVSDYWLWQREKRTSGNAAWHGSQAT